MARSYSHQKLELEKLRVETTNELMSRQRIFEHTDTDASKYAAAVMNYLTAEVVKLAGNVALFEGNTMIKPRHLQHAIRIDGELKTLVSKVVSVQDGVQSNSQTDLPKKTEEDKA